MKNRFSASNRRNKGDNPGASNPDERKAESKNLNRNKKRIGGGGLSLQTFAGLKSKTNGYNPAIIKKQREFYKNAKYVSKYKKVLKKENLSNEPSLNIESLENDIEEARDIAETTTHGKDKKKKHKTYKLNELYEQTRQEKEKAKAERDAIIQAKKQAKEEAESRRKTARKMMFKKTRSGQPVMKYRIEQLLETIQGSDKK